MYKNKINIIIETFSNLQDNDLLDVIEDLIQSAVEYIRKVTYLESALIVSAKNKSGVEYRDYIQKLDENRSISHNALISNVKVVNRICKKYSLPLIYEGDENDRVKIGNFAGELVNELFMTRRL